MESFEENGDRSFHLLAICIFCCGDNWSAAHNDNLKEAYAKTLPILMVILLCKILFAHFLEEGRGRIYGK